MGGFLVLSLLVRRLIPWSIRISFGLQEEVVAHQQTERSEVPDRLTAGQPRTEALTGCLCVFFRGKAKLRLIRTEQQRRAFLDHRLACLLQRDRSPLRSAGIT